MDHGGPRDCSSGSDCSDGAERHTWSPVELIWPCVANKDLQRDDLVEAPTAVVAVFAHQRRREERREPRQILRRPGLHPRIEIGRPIHRLQLPQHQNPSHDLDDAMQIQHARMRPDLPLRPALHLCWRPTYSRTSANVVDCQPIWVEVAVDLIV
uniref:Uncharacterized protein n=1 Tax=Mycena chlorophos TaxID=658473 RepID=A0ABQ0L4M6_MYCCL|nr:predicted protein [Mycena chlorophos]